METCATCGVSRGAERFGYREAEDELDRVDAKRRELKNFLKEGGSRADGILARRLVCLEEYAALLMAQMALCGRPEQGGLIEGASWEDR
ncbi:MAG: hypothetical protein MJ058_04250 [Akkermansia sp.]|nr:hypothetical protein [Akkermansia sp.]